MMATSRAWPLYSVAVAVAVVVTVLSHAAVANADGAHRTGKARVHRQATPPSKQKTFPAVKRSAFGGQGTAPLAFYVCSDAVDMGIRGKTPAIALGKCERSNKASSTKSPCRCAGRHAVAVYGPFKYPKPKKQEWYSNAEYPYEGSNDHQYSRDGYWPTP